MRTGRTDDLKSLYEKAFNAIGRGTETFSPRLEAREVGTVKTVNTGIATVSGLPGAGFEELLEFPGGIFGIAFNVDEDEIGSLAGSSTPWDAPSTAKARSGPLSACPSNGRQRPSWTGRR